MAYTVLARRYRSQTFDDVIGQDAVSQTLKNAIKSGRVAHAYLFSGTRGVGKTTMARVLAKSLNCLKADEPTITPCLECDSCVSVNIGEDIDVIEIDGASNTGVDNIRQLRQNAIYRPARARYKIYIIDEVHMLSTGAFNALLKILEEPPEHIKFIFATTEPNKVLPTIQSRCQRFDFGNIEVGSISGQLKAILKEEKIGCDDDVILHLSRLASGSMRDALSLLDRLISTGCERLTLGVLEESLGEPNREKMCELLDMIGENDAGGVLSVLDGLLKTGLGPSQIVDSMIGHMRDLLVIKSTDAKSDLVILTEREREVMAGLAEKFDIPGLIYGISALEKLRWSIKNSQTGRALLEASLVRLALSEHFLAVPALLSRLKSSSAGAGRGIKKKTVLTGSTRPVQSRPAVGSVDSSPAQSAPPARSSQGKTPPASGPGKSPDQSDQAPWVVPDSAFDGDVPENWREVLEAVGRKNANSASYMATAQSARWDGHVLKMVFPKSGLMAKNMCQRRIGDLKAAIGPVAGGAVDLEFELSSDEENAASQGNTKIGKKARAELLNDPAVQTLLTGLNATPTDICRIDGE